MSHAHVKPPIEPWCSATVREIPPVGMNGATLRVEVQGVPGFGGTYYWTPAQARAIFISLRAFNVLGDGPLGTGSSAPEQEIA
jgi:hypothetical protein